MEFITGTLVQCSGGNHLEIPITVNAVQHILKILKSDLDIEVNSQAEAEEKILTRLISAVKEANATTPIQIRNAVSNKTFEI